MKNDQAILELIAQTPKCRAVQLADWTDADLVDVQAALAGLLAVGDVVAEAGTSPAGNACQLYSLSARFIASDAYKPIAIKAAAAQFAAAHPDLSKTDRAIAFVRERGTASSYELHVVMGLKSTDTASAYLRVALSDGRLVRDGKAYVLGPTAAEASAQPAATPQAAGDEETKPVPQVPVIAAVKPADPAPQQPAAAPVPARAGITAAVYRCALWSDGILEVRKDGQTVAEMPQAAGESLAAFLARLTAAPAGAA